MFLKGWTAPERSHSLPGSALRWQQEAKEDGRSAMSCFDNHTKSYQSTDANMQENLGSECYLRNTTSHCVVFFSRHRKIGPTMTVSGEHVVNSRFEALEPLHRLCCGGCRLTRCTKQTKDETCVENPMPRPRPLKGTKRSTCIRHTADKTTTISALVLGGALKLRLT